MSVSEVAKSLHEKGNDEFKRGNFLVAREIYTDLLAYAKGKSLSSDRAYLAIILSNRAAVYLKLGFFELAWSDASFALHLDESNLKAAYRLSMVCYEMQNMKLAKATFAKYLPINSFSKEPAQSQSNGSNPAPSKPLSNDELDAMKTLLQHQSVCDELASLPEPNLVEEFLGIVYRDYSWENRRKSTLSLKAIRQQLFERACNTVCLQLIDGVGRGLVAKRPISRGEVIYESPLACCAVDSHVFESEFFRCFCCGADVAAICDDRFPVFTCCTGREVFCSTECFYVCQETFHKGCCRVLFDEHRRSLMRAFEGLLKSFPSWCRTPALIMRLFGSAKHLDVHPLELPILRYLKRMKEEDGAAASDPENVFSAASPQSASAAPPPSPCGRYHRKLQHTLPANFVVAYRLVAEMLDVCFDPRFDFWVFLTVHRILLVSCVVEGENSRFDCLVPAFSMLNHDGGNFSAVLEEVPATAPRRVRLVARRDVGAGEQLTIRYGDGGGDCPENSTCLFRYGVFSDAASSAQPSQ